jgi:hypothetical protein
MPIEIRELIIKTTLLDQSSSDEDTDDAEASRGMSETDKEALITQCVDAVLKILQRREER